MDQMNEQENSIQTEAQDPSEEPQPLSGVRRGFRWWIISTVLFVTVFLLVGVGYFLDIKQSNKQPSPATTPALQPIKVPTTSSIGNCGLIKLEAAKTQFCLDNRLIKNYDVEYFDWRDKKIKDQMKAGINIETQDYKESGETIIGSNSWREFKIVSGIKISFSADFNPRIKTFDELKNMYLKTFYEPHDEFPPHKGWKANSLNDLDYVYSLKRNDPESYSKGFEVETHFVKNDKKYELTIWASPKSISEENFRLLYNTILETLQFDSKTTKPQENNLETVTGSTYPRYGHAGDFSWISGKLEYQPLEGGCWTLNFAKKPEDAKAYRGILALSNAQKFVGVLTPNQFVVITGKVTGEKFSMACPPTRYEIETILANKEFNE